MDEFYTWIIIILLIAILAKLNQRNKKLTKEELEKQKKMMKTVWWIGGIFVGLMILYYTIMIWLLVS